MIARVAGFEVERISSPVELVLEVSTQHRLLRSFPDVKHPIIELVVVLISNHFAQLYPEGGLHFRTK